jgi:cytochrome c5
MSSSKIAIAAATLGAMTVWACASAPAQPAQAAQPVPAPVAAPAPAPAPSAAAPGSRAASGEELLNTVCTQCHTLDNLKISPHKADEWPDVIDKMVQFGAEISADDRKTIEAYLAAHYSAPN